MNGFYTRALGGMKIGYDFKFKDIITSDSLLQYNSEYDSYTLLCPTYKKFDLIEGRREKHCGIDPGIRTFLTIYSPNKSIEIGTSSSLYPLQSNFHKKISNINIKISNINDRISNFNLKNTKQITCSRTEPKKATQIIYSRTELKKKRKETLLNNNSSDYYKFYTRTINKSSHKSVKKSLKKAEKKYRLKASNAIADLHNKSANYLVSNYDSINIGRLGIQDVISKDTSVLGGQTKKHLLQLAHYRFRMKLVSMATKWNCKITSVNEFKTSRTCSQCHTEKTNLGATKEFICPNNQCKLVIDRDVNASINIYYNIAKTIYGKEVTIKVVDGKVYVNNAQVVTTDIQTSNGVIHVIDQSSRRFAVMAKCIERGIGHGIDGFHADQ